MPDGLAFVVRGIPVPQGSSRAFIRGGRAIVATEGNNQRAPLGAWRSAIATEARSAIAGEELLDGPVLVEVDFVFPRPKSHRRMNGELRLDAPRWHRSKPDADKLLRALLDAVTGVVFRDDSQVASARARKFYENDVLRPGCHVAIRPLEVTR